MTPKQRYEARAVHWEKSGRRLEELVPAGVELVRQHCWIHSEGAKKESVSALLIEFDKTSYDSVDYGAFGGWLDDLMRVRRFCHSCGETYRFENVSICTDCDNAYCPAHSRGVGYAANGNGQCACGGELVG